jgi:phosphohistidine phosphatase SixA
VHLYLVRHARPENATDIDPPLSKEGIEEAKMLGKLLAALQLQPKSLKIVSSDLLRSRDTAILMCQEMDFAGEVYFFPKKEEWSSDLKDRLMKILQMITGQEGRSEVIVVGHIDYLRTSLAWLVGDDTLPLPDIYGATACLDCDLTFGQGTGVLDWLVVPVLLGRLQQGMSAERPLPDK